MFWEGAGEEERKGEEEEKHEAVQFQTGQKKTILGRRKERK